MQQQESQGLCQNQTTKDVAATNVGENLNEALNKLQNMIDSAALKAMEKISDNFTTKISRLVGEMEVKDRAWNTKFQNVQGKSMEQVVQEILSATGRHENLHYETKINLETIATALNKLGTEAEEKLKGVKEYVIKRKYKSKLKNGMLM